MTVPASTCSCTSPPVSRKVSVGHKDMKMLAVYLNEQTKSSQSPILPACTSTMQRSGQGLPSWHKGCSAGCHWHRPKPQQGRHTDPDWQAFGKPPLKTALSGWCPTTWTLIDQALWSSSLTRVIPQALIDQLPFSGCSLQSLDTSCVNSVIDAASKLLAEYLLQPWVNQEQLECTPFHK